MTYVITQPCCNDATCVDVCPVDCIRPAPGDPQYTTAEMLYIDPQSCIDCGACADACPVDAIFPDHELTESNERYRSINADYFDAHPLEPSIEEVVTRRGVIPAGDDPVRIAIVGAGPSALYAATEIIDRLGGTVQIEIFDRLPTQTHHAEVLSFTTRAVRRRPRHIDRAGPQRTCTRSRRHRLDTRCRHTVLDRDRSGAAVDRIPRHARARSPLRRSSRHDTECEWSRHRPEHRAADSRYLLDRLDKTGPSGVIGSNKVCAADTVAGVLDDLASSWPGRHVGGRESLLKLLRERQSDLVDLEGWRAIEKAERDAGRSTGRPRRKIVDVATMLEATR